MPQKTLTIVPVTLHPAPNANLSTVSSTSSDVCAIKLGNAEITFQNGVEERIIQTIMRELIHR